MSINNVEYIGSWNKESDCPTTGYTEYAFIGRSNVGKSSLINLLTSRKKLAKVSSTPGKTQMINYFTVDDDRPWYLVDLPGYGYARISKKKRAAWKKMIDHYLIHRSTLACIFLLIDSRIPLQKIDLEFMQFLGENQLAFVIVFTKTDGSRPEQLRENIDTIKNELLMYWETLPQCFETSATKHIGAKEIMNFIHNLNNNA